MPRRVIAILALVLVALPLAGTAPVAAQGVPVEQLEAAEARVEKLINSRRASRDKRSFRHDSRVAAVARAKSVDMIERNYFDHRDRQGRYADDHLRRAGIRFSRVGEIIAWGRGEDLLASADAAVRLWMGSSVHKRQILTDNVYLGAGVATNGSTWKWTVIFITAPDRTPPTSRFTATGVEQDVGTAEGAASGELRLSWTGYDPLLVKGTAGLRGFDLERRAPEGEWQRIRTVTTSRSYVTTQPSGTVLEFRLRARDNNGNIGRWTEPVTLTVS
jgi:uncharacterized protein YkwD